MNGCWFICIDLFIPVNACSMNYFSYQKGAFGHGFSSNIFRKYFSIYEDFRNVFNVELKYQYLLPENWSHDKFYFS